MATNRKRWAGVHLGQSKRDRIVGEWLDRASKDPNVNISEIVKNYLYRVATGEEPPVKVRLEDLSHVNMVLETEHEEG